MVAIPVAPHSNAAGPRLPGADRARQPIADRLRARKIRRIACHAEVRTRHSDSAAGCFATMLRRQVAHHPTGADSRTFNALQRCVLNDWESVLVPLHTSHLCCRWLIRLRMPLRIMRVLPAATPSCAGASARTWWRGWRRKLTASISDDDRSVSRRRRMPPSVTRRCAAHGSSRSLHFGQTARLPSPQRQQQPQIGAVFLLMCRATCEEAWSKHC